MTRETAAKAPVQTNAGPHRPKGQPGLTVLFLLTGLGVESLR